MKHYKPLRRPCKRCEKMYIPETKYSEICQDCNLYSKKKRIQEYIKAKAQGKHKNLSKSLESLAGRDIYIFQPLRTKKGNKLYKRVCFYCEDLYDTPFKTSYVCDDCKKLNAMRAQHKQRITFQKRIIKSPIAFRKYCEGLRKNQAKANI